jgi:hypothetical protein
VEIVASEQAVSRAPTSNEPAMVFLVKIDGVVVVEIDSQ